MGLKQECSSPAVWFSDPHCITFFGLQKDEFLSRQSRGLAVAKYYTIGFFVETSQAMQHCCHIILRAF